MRRTILVLFFLSGACALVYEVVWMRMLTLVFGATAFATSTILASFFAGLALGSYWFGRVVDRTERSPLFTYALLEAGIAFFAFVMPALFLGVRAIYVGIAQTFDLGFYPISIIRFLLSFLVLVAPATLMGGTLPVMVKFFTRSGKRLAWNVGQLYAVNTFGAVVGTLSAGFVLILALGVREAAWLAGLFNLGIAVVILMLARAPEAEDIEGGGGGEGDTAGGEAAAGGPRSAVGAAYSAYSPSLARLALWAGGVSGFCALALEVFWTRSLVFFLDNSSHAFTTILTAFLLGIALGSIVIARFVDRARRLVAWLGVIQVLIGISAVLAIPILNHSTPVFARLAGEAVDTGLHWKWIGMRFVTSLSVMLVPTILMGMSFPVVARIYTRTVARVGTAVGDVYSVNTIGGVFGSVLAGFALVPVLGVQNGILLVAAINVGVGAVVLLEEPAWSRRARWAAVAAGAVVFTGVGVYNATTGGFVLTSYYEAVEDPEVLFYREGIGATVKVYEDAWGDIALSVNGFPVAGTAIAAQDAQRPLAHLPMLLSTVDTPRVNIVGFGAGGTSWGMTRYDVEAVDCVELVPAVVDAAPLFPEINHGVLREPDFNLIMGDGRNYALVTDEEYDVVSIDATSPKMAGNGSLYALEFYELLYGNLSDDGILVQWIPFHLLSEAEVRMIARTFQEAFPHTTAWFTPLRQYIILVGTKEPLRIDYQALARKLARPEVREELALLDVRGPIDLLGWFIMDAETLASYTGDIGLNTDNHPYLEFTPAMAYFVSDYYRIRTLVDLLELREPVLPLLTNLGDTEEEAEAVEERIRRRFNAIHHSLTGDIQLLLGNQDRAMAEFRTALRVDPTERNWLNAAWRRAR